MRKCCSKYNTFIISVTMIMFLHVFFLLDNFIQYQYWYWSFEITPIWSDQWIQVFEQLLRPSTSEVLCSSYYVNWRWFWKNTDAVLERLKLLWLNQESNGNWDDDILSDSQRKAREIFLWFKRFTKDKEIAKSTKTLAKKANKWSWVLRRMLMMSS